MLLGASISPSRHGVCRCCRRQRQRGVSALTSNCCPPALDREQALELWALPLAEMFPGRKDEAVKDKCRGMVTTATKVRGAGDSERLAKHM